MNFYVGNILTIVKNMDHFHIIKKNNLSIDLKIIKSIESASANIHFLWMIF